MNQKNKKDCGKRRSQGKKDYRKYDRRDEGRNSSDETEHKFNDVSWYAKNDRMLGDAASFSFGAPLGNPIPAPTQGVQIRTNAVSVPGVCSLYVVPTIGLSTSAISPANLAANNIYSYVRYMNSGAKNYDQADLMLYLLAMDSLYYCWNWGKRIYGYCMEYDTYNKYMPKGLAAADDVDLDAFLSSLAEFRYYLNATAARISSFCVPAVMPYYIRHSWMFSNIYKDSDSAKAQMYLFTPAIYYVYSEQSSKFGGELIAHSIKNSSTDHRFNFVDYKYIMDEMLAAVSYSEDIGVMSGDILKAYGQDKLFMLSPVDPEYRVVPVYNEEVLNQIHNSNICPVGWVGAKGKARADGNLNITQDPNTGFLKWNPTTTTTYVTSQSDLWTIDNHILNMPWDNVTPANSMVGTRLMADWDIHNVGKPENNIQVRACGSEVVVRRVYIVMQEDGSTFATTEDQSVHYFDASTLATSLIDIAFITDRSNFDWHPLVPIIVKNDSGITYCGYQGDINNYTYLQRSDLETLHSTALLSEFNIPQIGSF